jgi:hypothetical protein
MKTLATKGSRRNGVTQEKALKVLQEAFGAYAAWSDKERAQQDARTSPQDRRGQVQALGKAHRALEAAIEAFGMSPPPAPDPATEKLEPGSQPQAASVSREPDATLLGQVFSQVRLREHLQLVARLREALYATRYLQRAGDAVEALARRRTANASMMWVTFAAHSWRRQFGTAADSQFVGVLASAPDALKDHLPLGVAGPPAVDAKAIRKVLASVERVEPEMNVTSAALSPEELEELERLTASMQAEQLMSELRVKSMSA